MKEQEPSPAEDWSAGRGEKWLANLAGMEATLEPVTEPLLRALQLDAALRIADIGCGGGGTTLEIGRRAPAGSVVQGFDLSPVLVEAASHLAAAEGSAVTFEVADMGTASPPGEPYDRLISRFGIMFFADPPSAFVNLRRWLAPGGRFAFAAWGPPARNPWLSTLRETVAEIIEVPKPDPTAPGPFRYGEPCDLLTLLDRAGFEALNVSTWYGTLALGGGLPAEAAADFAMSAFSSVSEFLAEAGDKTIQEARRLLTTRLAGHQQEGKVKMDACVHLFTGRR